MARVIRRGALLEWAFPACYPDQTDDATEGTPGDARERTFAQDVGHHFAHHLPVVVVLVSLATVLHHHHWLAALTAQTMRLVYAFEARFMDWTGKETQAQAARKTPEPAAVTLLRFSPKGFENEFCGLSPVPRNRMAAVIERLANALGEPGPGAPLPVIGIDVDITSLRGSPNCVVNLACRAGKKGGARAGSCDKDADLRIRQAISALATRAQVVVVAFPRLDADARKVRNESMKELCALGVRFASAQAFLDPGEPFYHFLNTRQREAKVDWSTKIDAEHQLPPYFPSLGNLMSLLARSPDVSPQKEQQRQSAVMALCRAAGSAFPESLLFAIGDTPNAAAYGPTEFRAEELYQWAYLDLLRGSVRTAFEPLGSIRDMETEVSKIADEWKNAPARSPRMLIVSIDDGRTDKYFTVQNVHAAGDSIQGLIAFSQSNPLRPWPKILNAVFDFVLGCVYLACWVIIWIRMERLRREAPYSASAVLAIAPAVLTGLLAVGTVLFSAWMLRHGRWIDPLFILLGLTVHAYLTLAPAAAQITGGAMKYRRPVDKHVACGVSVVLRIIAFAIVLWAIVLMGAEIVDAARTRWLE